MKWENFSTKWGLDFSISVITSVSRKKLQPVRYNESFWKNIHVYFSQKLGGLFFFSSNFGLMAAEEQNNTNFGQKSKKSKSQFFLYFCWFFHFFLIFFNFSQNLKKSYFAEYFTIFHFFLIFQKNQKSQFSTFYLF